MTEPPLIVQADGAVLLETQHPGYEAARERLATFAELEKSPEYVHFYRITPISIWNAAALGETAATADYDSSRHSFGGGRRRGRRCDCGQWERVRGGWRLRLAGRSH